MATIDEARSKWQLMLDEGTPQQVLFDSHPLHLYFGVSPIGAPLFLLISDDEPELPQLSGLVSMETRRRADGRWASPLVLKQDAYAETFIGMCLELARRTQLASSSDEAQELFLLTLRQWQKLLTFKGAKRLSDREIRGLMAELAFAIALSVRLPIPEVIDAWQGPLGAPQDFRHENFGLFEVKSLRQTSRVVRISSVRQLDPVSDGVFHLVTIEIDEDPLGVSTASISLIDQISRVRTIIGPHQLAMDLFETRLAALGIDVTDQHYAEVRYTVGAMSTYLVADEGFPRMRTQDIPHGVEELTYALRLDHLQSFRSDLFLNK